jgi:hypothetical protein
MFMVRVTRGDKSREIHFKTLKGADDYIRAHSLPGLDFDLCRHVGGCRWEVLDRVVIRSGTAFNYNRSYT